ncbi:MAG: hypothetical protein SF002_11570 [Alphaproteobacteria bacterium]|nr:hypothetical protein [Alphaproteobacteria bacterium]
MSNSGMPLDDYQVLGVLAAPEHFVEGYRGATCRAGLVKLNFFSNRFDPATNLVQKQAVCTLAIPAEDLIDVVRGLSDLVAGLKPTSVPTPDSSDAS